MDTRLDRSLLSGVEVFRGLDGAALDDIARAARLRRAAKDGIVFAQGDEANAFHVLIAGRVKIGQITPEGHHVAVRYIGPGEIFGGVAVFCHIAYPGTATAVVDSVVASWERAAIAGMIERHPRFVANALAIVGKRLQEVQNRYRELATERVERRVAHAVLRLMRQAGREVETGTRIEFPVSRQDIAEMTGTTLHTVSRILSAWEAAGIVEGGRQRLVIRAVEALAAIADDLPAAAAAAAAERNSLD
jgi:CRP-like cAMP-binding protein